MGGNRHCLGKWINPLYLYRFIFYSPRFKPWAIKNEMYKMRLNGFYKTEALCLIRTIEYGQMPSDNQRRGKWINPLHLYRCIL